MPVTSQTQTLVNLGWSDFFQTQLSSDELEQKDLMSLVPMHITKVHRVRLHAEAEDGNHVIMPTKNQNAAHFAVGDWILVNPVSDQILRRLERENILQRLNLKSENQTQLIAANIDTLFIVSSCNVDFKIEWIDRFLAMASEAGVTPVIILTKADSTTDPDRWVQQAKKLSPDLAVEALNTHDPAQVRRLDKWCLPGQNVAMVGSSGVGKSTLLNALCNLDTATDQIRESDAQGRHTTTARSLHQTTSGGWLLDTPGIRVLHLYDAEEAIGHLFSDITKLTKNCHFRDCNHVDQPNCAVIAALSDGTLDQSRFKRWNKLRRSSNLGADTPIEAPLTWQEQRRIAKAIKQDQIRLTRRKK